MPQPIVLVIFYSRSGRTEKLALAAAVGAVQGRALIRLRRLPDISSGPEVQEFPEAREALLRMQKEYVPPKESDILAADAIIIATPSHLKTSENLKEYFDVLARLRSEGKLDRKIITALVTKETFAESDAIEKARLQGRNLAATLQAGK